MMGLGDVFDGLGDSIPRTLEDTVSWGNGVSSCCGLWELTRSQGKQGRRRRTPIRIESLGI
jgi:hypothetical protein